MTLRFAEISSWLTNLFPAGEIRSLSYIESDASARKYLRCNLNGESYIIMDTTPGQEQINFAKVAKVFSDNKINAPVIITNDLERGLILMNDFGDQTYLGVLKRSDPETIDRLYLDAIYSLINIQNVAKSADFAVMDNDYIANRLDIFKTWYLQKHLQIELDSKIDIIIAGLHKIFADAFNELPQVLVHLDYHCRNLMYVPHSNMPGILDFQDAMFGPITYDLVSLFQDAYITWPRQQVEAWVKVYYDLATAAGLLDVQNFDVVIRNFDLVGLQRHIKNLGVFARLYHRDNKAAYLNHVPTLLTYIMDTCNRYDELADLRAYLTDNVLENADMLL